MDNVRKKRENDEGRRVCSFRVGKCQKKDGSGRSGTKTFNGSFQTARATKEGRSKN
jgi:hypothetical protein